MSTGIAVRCLLKFLPFTNRIVVSWLTGAAAWRSTDAGLNPHARRGIGAGVHPYEDAEPSLKPNARRRTADDGSSDGGCVRLDHLGAPRGIRPKIGTTPDFLLCRHRLRFCRRQLEDG